MATERDGRAGSAARRRRTTYRERSAEPFGIVYVIVESTKILAGSFPGLMGLGLLVVVPTFALAVGSLTFLLAAPLALEGGGAQLALALAPVISFAVLTLWLLVGWSLLQNFVLAAVNQRLRGRPLALGRCIRYGLSRLAGSLLTVFLILLASTLLLLVGATISFVLGGLVGREAFANEPYEVQLAASLWTMLGSAVVFVVIPSAAVGCMFWVAMPVAVAERRAGSGALSRSVHLSRGYRWPIFAIILIQGAVDGLGRHGIVSLMGGVETEGTAMLAVVVLAVFALVTVTWMAIASGVGYHRLRYLKEGADADVIARVFE